MFLWSSRNIRSQSDIVYICTSLKWAGSLSKSSSRQRHATRGEPDASPGLTTHPRSGTLFSREQKTKEEERGGHGFEGGRPGHGADGRPVFL